MNEKATAAFNSPNIMPSCLNVRNQSFCMRLKEGGEKLALYLYKVDAENKKHEFW